MIDEKSHLRNIGKTYSMFNKDVKVNTFRRRTILAYAKGPKILELGCADGLMTEALTEKFKDVSAVDASEELLQKAKQRAPKASYHQALFEEFNPDDRFDTIILGHVLEHVEDPIVILKRVQQWLSSTGIIIITVPNGNSFHRRLGVEMGMLKSSTQLNQDDIDCGHRRVFTLDVLRNVIVNSGLNIVKEEGIMFKPLSNRQMIDWPDERLEACYQLGRKLPAEFGGELCIICEKTL